MKLNFFIFILQGRGGGVGNHQFSHFLIADLNQVPDKIQNFHPVADENLLKKIITKAQRHKLTMKPKEGNSIKQTC